MKHRLVNIAVMILLAVSIPFILEYTHARYIQSGDDLLIFHDNSIINHSNTDFTIYINRTAYGDFESGYQRLIFETSNSHNIVDVTVLDTVFLEKGAVEFTYMIDYPVSPGVYYIETAYTLKTVYGITKTVRVSTPEYTVSTPLTSSN